MSDLSNLAAELARMRELAQLARDAGDWRAEQKILESIAYLAREYDRHEILASRYLHAETVKEIANALTQIVTEEVRLLPDWENALDRIWQRIGGIQMQNTPKQIRSITYDK